MVDAPNPEPVRRPLRPLARVLAARASGENPDRVEHEARAARAQHRHRAERERAETRLLLMAAGFLIAFAAIGVQMGLVAASEAGEPKRTAATSPIVAQRADIVDREGRVLAKNVATYSLYAQRSEMVDPRAAADGLTEIFPDLDADRLFLAFKTKDFHWIKRSLSPEQRQAVHDLGEPGLLFGPREMRLYPNGRLAAHVLGGTGFGIEAVHAAEIVGRAGVEKTFDAFLRDPAEGGRPLRLSLDLSVQAATARVLASSMRLFDAKGASAVLMEAGTGKIRALVSLPDFDPNDRPLPPSEGDPSESPLFNRAAQGVYELGSTFKIFTVAEALEAGRVSPQTLIDTEGPMVQGRHRIRDFRDYGPVLSVTDVIVKSSNIGTARMALAAGAPRQRAFLEGLGLFEPAPIELPEARRARPLVPKRWSDIHTMTVSYGHGIAATPVHLAAAYASVVNGGTRVGPTLLEDGAAATPVKARVISERTSRQLRAMLRDVVVRGTASLGDVPGYRVGGKTGTADKPKATGGYYDEKVIATFAAIFPADRPEYVLVVTLDEPEDRSGTELRRTAGWTAVPVTFEIIRRIAPLMNMRPVRSDLEAAE